MYSVLSIGQAYIRGHFIRIVHEVFVCCKFWSGINESETRFRFRLRRTASSAASSAANRGQVQIESRSSVRPSIPHKYTKVRNTPNTAWNFIRKFRRRYFVDLTRSKLIWCKSTRRLWEPTLGFVSWVGFGFAWLHARLAAYWAHYSSSCNTNACAKSAETTFALELYVNKVRRDGFSTRMVQA